MPSTAIASELDSPYTLSKDAIQHFQTEGYVKLKHVLSPEVLDYYGREITSWVHKLNSNTKPMSERNTYQKAFIQVHNLFRHSEVAKAFCFSSRLARIAAELMGVKGVRLYHDQALYKEPNGGVTPWHADQFYWPLSTPNTVTVWIPFQATPIEMGPLAFAARSQNFEFGRDMAISDESEKQLAAALDKQNFVYNETPFDLGEVSYHYGWTFHRAGPNLSKLPRAVMTMIYMDADIKVIQPKNSAQEADLAHWLPGCKPGEIANSELNPVLYSA
jgi:ectoine hydroxylase-related dioxygenase (phytanoyl-CoA dioxygenase family)